MLRKSYRQKREKTLGEFGTAVNLRQRKGLGLGKEFDGGRAREDSGGGSAGNQFLNGLTALVAVTQSPLVDVHADELIGDIRFHVARELHGVFQGVFAMLEAVLDALADGLGDEAAKRDSERLANGVAAERERESGLLLPPDAEIQNFVKTELGKQELALVDKKAGFDDIFLHGFEDFVERHDHGFKVRLEKLESEVRGSFEAGNGDALALEVIFLERPGGNDDGAVAFAEAGAAIEKQVLVANGGIGGEADGGDVVGLCEGGFVEGLDIGKDVGVLVTGSGELVGGEGVEHEGVVGIGRMGELDFDRLLFGFEGRFLSCHGVSCVLFTAEPRKLNRSPGIPWHGQRRDPSPSGEIGEKRRKKTFATLGRAWRGAGSL